MTNRQWLESLTKEELVSWLLDEEIYNGDKFIEPSPKLNSLKYGATNSRAYLLKWLDEERKQ